MLDQLGVSHIAEEHLRLMESVGQFLANTGMQCGDITFAGHCCRYSYLFYLALSATLPVILRQMPSHLRGGKECSRITLCRSICT